MFSKTLQLDLPRRIVAVYSIFCLVSIAWLTLGVYVVSRSHVSERATSTCLAQLGQASSRIEIDHLRNGSASLQSNVDRIRSEARVTYCAVVSNDGTYLAHTSPDLVGQQCVEQTGESLRWGDVRGVRFEDDQGEMLREYRVPLENGESIFGTLRLAVAEASIWSTVATVTKVIPLAILAPLALVGAGGLVLRRMVRPISEIETQLRSAANVHSGSDLAVQRVESTSGAALGWNRVVDRLNEQVDCSPLEQRISDAVASRKQSRTDTILQSISDGIAVTDPEGRIEFANNALAAILGVECEGDDLNGESIRKYVESTEAEEQLGKLFDESKSLCTVAVEFQRNNGSSGRHLRCARYPLRSTNEYGGDGYVWSLRDVTQQKLADKMRDQVLDTATHELRTPLANIKAYAETLAMSESLEIEDQKTFCNTINSEATRLARLIDDLLSISSMEVGSLTIDRQRTETDRLLDEVINKVKPLMEQKAINFNAMFPEKLPEINIDKDKVSAALVNLLGNAAKYTPDGGSVSLRVTLPQGMLQIDVEDSGVGISEEELPRVFDKFFRSSDPKVQEQVGTGLGLSLAYEVARLHNGEIVVRSEVNKGTNFTFRLPLL